MKRIITALLLLVPACLWAQTDYADKALWYEGEKRLDAANIAQQAGADVFYVLPTCVFAWEDAQGVKHYNADPRSEEHIKAWSLSAELADSIFATAVQKETGVRSHRNLFLPYYRQSTFGTPDRETQAAAGAIARADVVAAFRYYMEHLNGGRPFVLAGFSQGARMVLELLHEMDDKTYSQLVAAYLLGCGVTAQDTVMTANHAVQHVRLAQGATDTGVIISYNSVTPTLASAPGRSTNYITCMNPVNWSTGAEKAVLLPAGATPEADDPRFPYGTAVVSAHANQDVTVRVDTEQNVLVVEGVEDSRYALPSLGALFPLGNLHLQEPFFYARHLRDNVTVREAAFMKQK